MSKEKSQVKSFGEREIDRAQEKFEKFEEDVQKLTLDEMNKAPLEDVEPQTRMSSTEQKKAPDIYLKPKRSFPPAPHPKTGRVEQFNEKFRKEWEYDKKYVQFIAENYEIIGESICLWTKPYAGVPAEEWVVPVNKPVWGPRYLAEQVKRCKYHVLSMEEHTPTSHDGFGTYLGAMVVKQTKHRLDAHPVSNTRISLNKKASNF